MRQPAFLKKPGVKTWWPCFAILGAALLLEATVFNYKAYKSQGEEKDYPLASLSLGGFQAVGSTPGVYEATTVRPFLTLGGLDSRMVKSLYFDCEPLASSNYRLELSVSSVAANGERETLAQNFEIVSGDEPTQYLETSFIRPSEYLTITFLVGGNGSSPLGSEYRFGGAAINKRIPFHFSAARVAVVALPALVVYFGVFFFRKRNTFLPGLTVKSLWPYLFYGGSLIGVIGIFAAFGNFQNPILQSSGSEVSQEMVDGFLAGRVDLLATPSQALLALANPYDPAARSGVAYLWDHLLYNGHYYSYYGVTPVFLFFLPWHIVSGQYAHDAYGVLFFTLVGTVFLALAWKRLLKGLFPSGKLPFYLDVGGFYLLFLGSGALSNLERPSFYESATSCAFMAMMISLFCLANTRIFDRRRPSQPLSLGSLASASLWLALAVLSRATMALYAFGFLAWVLFYDLKNRKTLSGRYRGGYWCAALIPLAVFAVFQMVYNDLRFQNPLDFGIEYSLTIADFKNMPFSATNAMTSFWNFFFAAPAVTSDYFFLNGTFVRFGNAYYFFETGAQFGLFARMPLYLAAFVLPFFKKRSGKEWGKWLLLEAYPALIVPVILVLATWQSGYASRYFSDFGWAIGLYALLLILEEYCEEPLGQRPERERILATLFIGSLVYSFGSTFLFINMYTPDVTQFNGARNWSYTAYWCKIGRELTFWR